MAKKIGIQLYLDGASKFNSDVRACDNSLKQFQSELKITQLEFRNNENSFEALAKKSESLQKAYDSSTKKVEIYQKRIQDLNKAREEEKQRIESLKKNLDDEQRELVKIEYTSGKNSQAYQKQSEACLKLENSIKTATAEVNRLDNEEIKLNTSLNNAAAEQLKYGNELEKTNKYLAEAESSADGYAKSLDRTGYEIDQTSNSAEKMNKALDDLIQNEAFEKISEGAKKVVEAMVECAETAEKFEYSIAKVQSIAQVSGGELDQMSSEIRRVATEMGYSANEVSEAVYQAISASVDASEAVGFVEDATKLARAGFTETTTAVDVLTTAINAYGKEANTTAHIADDLITTQNLGKTTVDELAQSIGTVIPTASALGVSLDQLSSMYVLMTKQGINTANATTYIRAMMNELSDSSKGVSITLGELTGHTFGELMSKGYTLGDVMQILGDSVNGNSEAFKNLFGNVRAGLGALSLFNQGADVFNDTLAKMENNIGATDMAFETMSDTAEMTNQRLAASVENFKISVGESLSPTLDKFKEMGINILNIISDVIEEHPGLVAAITGATTAIATMAAIVTTAAMAVGILRMALGDGVTAAKVFATVGLVAATGAISGLAIQATTAKKEVDKFNQSMEASTQAALDLHANVDEFLYSSESISKHVNELIDRIDRLNSSENLNTKQKNELRKAVNDLNVVLGETVVEIDSETGYLKDNTDEWKKNAQSREESAKLQGLEERYTSVMQERAKVEAELWEIDEKRKDLIAEASPILEEYNRLTEKGLTLDIEEQDAYEKLKAQAEGYNEQIYALVQAYGEKNYANKQLLEDEEKLRNAIDETTVSVDEAKKAAGEYTDSLGVVHDSSLSFTDAEEAISNALAAANEAIEKQIGLFDEWNKTSDLSLSEMEERWKKQTEGINQYSDDLAFLRNVITTDTDPAIQDLAKEMANMGIDGSAEIHNFVEGLKEVGNNQDKIKELAQTWQEHIDAIKSAEDIYASIVLQEQNYTEDSDALFTQYYTDSEKAREEFNTNMFKLAEQGVQDQAKAIEDNAPLVAEATQSMMETSFSTACESIGMPTTGGESSKFKTMGQNIVDSIKAGIEDGGSVIGSALNNAFNNAVNSMDVSGIANRINQQLGATVSHEKLR